MTALELAAIALAAGLQVDGLATFSYSRDDAPRCARVSLLDVGPGRVAYAWLVVAGDAPRNVVHRPLYDLRPGCERAPR